MINFLRGVLLVSVSTIMSLAMAEGVLRVIDGFPLTQISLLTGDAPVSPRPARVPEALSDPSPVVERLPVPVGVDRAWFNTEPPPIPHKPANALHTEILAQKSMDFSTTKWCSRVWNRYLVYDIFSRSVTRGAGAIMHRFPERIMVFDPGEKILLPRYRLLPDNPNAEANAEAQWEIANNLGYRGRDVSLVKPHGLIRLVFLGASTTIHAGQTVFTYPDYVAHYFSQWAQSKGIAARFEAVNAAREGFKSHDLREVARQEVRYLDPDVVVYMEGANQFSAGATGGYKALLKLPLTQAIQRPAEQDFGVEQRVSMFQGVYGWSALARRVGLWRSPFQGPMPEANKPKYKIKWPQQVDESTPDPDSPDLPLFLPEIVADIDAIREALAPTKAKFALSSFIWLSYDGMMLDYNRPSDRSIHWYLNGHDNTWPLTYRDIRRLADFQNRVFRNYADKRGVTFVDVARDFPQDPGFFWDGIHKYNSGIKLHAWLVFLELLPSMEQWMAAGELPRTPDPNPGKFPTDFQVLTVADLLKEMGDIDPESISRPQHDMDSWWDKAWRHIKLYL